MGILPMSDVRTRTHGQDARATQNISFLMSALSRFAARFRALLRRKQLDAEMAEEMRHGGAAGGVKL